MNILVTGKTGKLGRIMMEESPKTSNRYFFTDSSDLNILDSDAVNSFIADNKIKVIINAAAYTNVYGAEIDFSSAFSINATALGIIARAAIKNDCYVIHISTDYVFSSDINRKPFTEDDIPRPLNNYGKTKLEGEKILMGSGCHFLIFRTSWLYSEYPPNFVTSACNNMLSCCQLSASVNHVGSPTYIRDLAKAIYHVVENELFFKNEGIYHLSAIGSLSMYEINNIVANTIKSKCDVIPLKRSITDCCPGFTSLNVEKFQKTFNYVLPKAESSIIYVADVYCNKISFFEIIKIKAKKCLFKIGLKPYLNKLKSIL